LGALIFGSDGGIVYGPNDKFFKVCADDGNLYILRHNLAI